MWHMEVPKLEIELELQLPAYATATAMPDPSCVCNLHHSSRQCRILNPLSEARDRTCILMDITWVCYFVTVEPQGELLYFFYFLSLDFFFRATPAVFGGSQTRGRIGAAAAGHSHSHINTRPESRLQPTPQLTAAPYP